VITIVVLELIAELSACASLSMVLRSIDEALLERVQVTVPDPEQLAVLDADRTREVPVPIATTATIHIVRCRRI
jgi:hypothetical protein